MRKVSACSVGISTGSWKTTRSCGVPVPRRRRRRPSSSGATGCISNSWTRVDVSFVEVD